MLFWLIYVGIASAIYTTRRYYTSCVYIVILSRILLSNKCVDMKNLRIYIITLVLNIAYLKEKITMDTKTKLFLSLAMGRAICGFCAMTGILFLTWLTENLGKTGLSLSEILGTIGMVILTVLFANKTVLQYTAKVPYKTLVVNSATFIVDGITILLLGDYCPYAVLVSGVLSTMCDKAYLQSRKILFNRVYHGDELTLIGNRLEVIAIVAALGGSAVAIVVPATTNILASAVIIAAVLLTIANYYQIKYLLILQDTDDTFHERVAKQRAALREQYLNNGE